MPKPQIHALSAAVLLLLDRARPVFEHPRVAATATVLVDADHLVDWAAYRVLHRRNLQIIPFHSWELAALLVCSKRPVLRSLGAGLLLHFALDMTIGGYSFRRLSLAYRIRHRMGTDWLGDWVLWPGHKEQL